MRHTTVRPNGAPRSFIVQRTELRTAARALMRGWRDDLQCLVLTCNERPQPKDLVRDVERDLNASEETVFAATIAVVPHATDAGLAEFTSRMHARLLTFRRAQRPLPSYASVWDEDIVADGHANVAEKRFEEALRTGDRCAMDRYIEAKANQVRIAQQLLTAMVKLRDSAVGVQ